MSETENERFKSPYRVICTRVVKLYNNILKLDAPRTPDLKRGTLATLSINCYTLV